MPTIGAEMTTALHAYDTVGSSGINRIHPSLNHALLETDFAKSRKDIRLLQTWVGNLTGLLGSLDAAVKEGCTIRILLLKPDSPLAVARSLDYGEKEDFAAEHIKVSIRQLKSFCEKWSKGGIKVGGDDGQLMVRLYDATPIFTIYAADSVTYVGFYWRKQPALGAPQIELSRQGYLTSAIDNFFDDLWKKPDNVPLEKWP